MSQKKISGIKWGVFQTWKKVPDYLTEGEESTLTEEEIKLINEQICLAKASSDMINATFRAARERYRLAP